MVPGFFVFYYIHPLLVQRHERVPIPPKPKQAPAKGEISTLLRAIEGTNTYLFCMIGLYSVLRRVTITQTLAYYRAYDHSAYSPTYLHFQSIAGWR